MRRLLIQARHRNFQRLWWAQLISQVGDRIHQFALIALAAEKAPHDTTFSLAKLLACTIVPVFVVQPFAGVFVDRWDRKTTLLICDFARAGLVMLIPLGLMDRSSLLPVYGVVFLIFCFSRFYLPARLSIVPDIVDRRQLFAANSLVSSTGMVAFIVGSVAGGFLVDHWGARRGFWIDALTFLISGLLLGRLTTHCLPLKKGKTSLTPASVWREIGDGLRYVWRHPEIRMVHQILFVLLAAAGSVYVVIIVFIQQAFGSVTKDLGVLSVVLGAGLLTGALAYGRWGRRESWKSVTLTCLAAGGGMLVVFAVGVSRWPSLGLAGVLAFLWGAVLGPIFIAANAVTHLVSEEAMRGKVFSAMEIVIHLAFLSAMLLSSWLAGVFEPVWILIAAGVGIMGAAAWAWPRMTGKV